MKTSKQALQTLEGLALKPFSLHFFNPSFGLTNLDEIANTASRHCHNSYTWPFGQNEVQLREFVSTLHVQPLSSSGNLAADKTHKHSESYTTFSNSKVALASTARFAPSYATQPLARNVSTLLEEEGRVSILPGPPHASHTQEGVV